MRIITGKNKGKGIRMPAGIRPTQNKVRKAIFDILGDIGGLSFLELFAGSGAVGFEAASRGVTELILVEYNSQCVEAIKKNIASLKLANCKLYSSSVEKAIEALSRAQKDFDIIFLDPPYYKDGVLRCPHLRSISPERKSRSSPGGSLTKKTLQMLDAYDILAPNGVIAVQHFRKDTLPSDLKNLALARQKHYGDTTLSFFLKKRLT